MDIALLGLGVDSSQAVKATTDLEKLSVAAGRAENAAEKMGRATDTAFKYFDSAKILSAQRGLAQWTASQNQAASGSGRFSNAMTNASFQIQDFAVQVASGQSALMAFAQQFPQLTGALGFAGKAGLYGALIGTAAAIGVALYGAMAKAEEKAKTLDESVSDLDASFSSLSEYIKLATTDTAELSLKFGAFADQVKAFNEYASGIALQESLEGSVAVVDALRANLDGVKAAYDRVNEAQTLYNQMVSQGFANPSQIADAADVLAMFKDELDASASAIGLSADQALRLRDSLEAVKATDSLPEQARAASEVLRYMESIYGNARKLPSSLRPIYTEMLNIASKASAADMEFDKFPDSLTAAVAAANNLSGSVSAIGGAAARTQTAIENMANALRSAAGMAIFGPDTVPQVPSGLGNFGPNPLGQGLAPGSSPRPPQRPTLQHDPNWGWADPAKKGGGGGGAGSDPYADNLQRLMESLRTEAETVDAWYQENQTILNDRRAAEILGEQAHNDAKLALEQEYLARKQELQDGYNEFSLSSADKLFGEMHSLSGSRYEGLLKLQKSFAAAQALVNTYTAASQVLADPSVGFFAKFAAVAKTIAAGMGLVNAIKGGGAGGGGSSGGSSSATSSATSSREPERVTRIELIGDDWLVNLTEAVLSQTYEATKNGRVIIGRA